MTTTHPKPSIRRTISDPLGKHPHVPGIQVQRALSVPEPHEYEHKERVFSELRRSTPFFKSANGNWHGVVTNHFALGNPLWREFIVPPGRLEGRHGDEWHHRLNRFLHHWKTHTVLNVLLILDVLLIITAISLELAFVESEVRDLEHQCEEVHLDMRETCSDHPGNQTLKEAFEAVEIASLCVLFIFAFDNFLLLIANGWAFFKSPLYVFDSVVVVLAIIFETVLRQAVAGGVIIIARAWRFVRIGHGIYETTHDPAEEEHFRQKASETNNNSEKKKNKTTTTKRASSARDEADVDVEATAAPHKTKKTSKNNHAGDPHAHARGSSAPLRMVQITVEPPEPSECIGDAKS